MSSVSSAVVVASALNQVIRNAQRLGATIPEALLTEHAKVTKIAQRGRTLKAELGHDIGAAVVAALEADRDPFTDPGVTEAVVRRAVTEGGHGVAAAVADRAARFVEEHALDLLDVFRGPFDEAAATITEGHRVLGDADLDNTRAIGKLGGEAGRAWADVQAAEKVIGEVQQAWKLLSQVAGHAVPWFPQYRLLTIADVPADVWVAENLSHTRVTPWDAARHGWPLDLATPDRFRERMAAVNAAAQAQRAAGEQAFRDGWRRMHGTGQPIAT